MRGPPRYPAHRGSATVSSRELGVRGLQRVLGPLLVLYIVADSVPADDLAVLIAQRHAAHQEPAIFAVSSAETLLHFERLPCRQVSAPSGINPREIIGMDRDRPALPPQAVLRETDIGSPGLIDEIGRAVGSISRHECRDGVDGYPKLSFGLPL